jgi:6-phosphofructokinase 1
VGHTQRGGRPILFDRYYAAQHGGKAVDLLLEGRTNAVSILQYDKERGFHLDGIDGNDFRDRWGLTHARAMHSALYDPERMMPSRVGVEYLLPIFSTAIGQDDMEAQQRLLDSGNLTRPDHSVNTDVNKRIRYLE